MKKFMLNLALCLMFVCSACTQQSDPVETEELKESFNLLTNRKLTPKDYDELGKVFSKIELETNPDGTWTVISKSGKDLNVAECYFDYVVRIIETHNENMLASRYTRTDILEDCVSRPDSTENISKQKTDCVAYSIAHAINRMDKLSEIKMRLEERYGTQGILTSKIKEALDMFGNWNEIGNTETVSNFVPDVNQGIVIARPSNDNPNYHAVNIWRISDNGMYVTHDYQNLKNGNPNLVAYRRDQLCGVFILVRAFSL